MTVPGRYHLLLESGGRPIQHGWWDSEATARRKMISWIRERGSMPGARVTLTDEETAEVLATWPEEP
ncbi:hypothetical protein ACH5A3_21245 [Streptomyces echinatus]|uniref:hypothetical protein n=1 Tax=Streptomyces echinatus TaxID=67293 RepID=UPI0037BA4250